MVIVGSKRMVQYDDAASDASVRVYDRGLDLALPAPANFGEHQLTYRSGDMVAPRIDAAEPLSLELEPTSRRDQHRRPAALARPPRARDRARPRRGEAVARAPRRAGRDRAARRARRLRALRAAAARRGRLMAQRRVLFISENAPVPADRRVWNEARSLTAAGWEVTIVCAQGVDRDSTPHEVLEGIEIHRFPLAPASGGPVGYLREYAQAMWRIRKLVRKLARTQHFDVVHACNPPDFLLLAARSLRRTRHAVRVRPPRPRARALPLALRRRHRPALPRRRGARAGRVPARRRAIATNESYRRSRIERGQHGAGGRVHRPQRAEPRPLPPGRPRPGAASAAAST